MEAVFAGLNFLEFFLGLLCLLLLKAPSVFLGLRDSKVLLGKGEIIPGLGVNALDEDFGIKGVGFIMVVPKIF